MPYKYAKLRGRITEVYGNQKKFAKALGVSQQAVSKMLCGKSSFSQRSIIKWAEILDIPQSEYLEYFFA